TQYRLSDEHRVVNLQVPSHLDELLAHPGYGCLLSVLDVGLVRHPQNRDLRPAYGLPHFVHGLAHQLDNVLRHAVIDLASEPHDVWDVPCLQTLGYEVV